MILFSLGFKSIILFQPVPQSRTGFILELNNILIWKWPCGMVKHAAQASGKEAFLTSAGEWAMFLTSTESQSLCSSLKLAYSVVVAEEKCSITLHLG